MPAKVLNCTCKHTSQDKLHGENMRVYIQTREQDGKVFRCSICLKTKSVGGDAADNKKKK